MTNGFWAGAVPPWAYVVGGGLCLAFLFAGMWVGYGRGWDHAKEDDEWGREQAKARRTHPVYRQPLWEYRAETPALVGQVVHAPEIDTGEIQAITDRVDEWMATWIGQETG